ncbi:MAG: DUF4433 domain-containing protein [Deltaproteobacteria bacterium]|nr:DUF4433 domain-containing protein [Deltaproteobacteria bacterium]
MKKQWRPKIKDHIEHWSGSLSGHAWWPRYVYFFTDLRNAVSILEKGCLLSRDRAEGLDSIEVNGASREIIDQTREECLKFVRLYYRPRTPTQYRCEGIRPPGERWQDAHCPVPVFFLFDAYEVMSRDDAQYSDGSMASPYAIYGPEEKDFDRIPFNKVFHYGRYDTRVEGDIKFHRHAELLIPGMLPLKENLKLIACRSHAERQSLLYLLPPSFRKQWQSNLIRIGDSSMYERQWAYVNTVETENQEITFHFNRNSQHAGQFEATVFLRFPSGEERPIKKSIDAKSPFTIKIEEDAEEVEVELWLDDALAYHNNLLISDVPF